MKRAVNASAPSQSKIDHIKSGGKVKSQLGGVKENKNVIHGKDGKFTITEKEKKFEEAGVTRKKRNYVMYESKLGTEKEQEVQHIKEVKKQKPKVVPQPRNEEKIITQMKRVEYLDNYQYHETKDIKDNDPNKQSIVTHQRLGDIVGGSYEEKTFQRITMNDPGKGPKLYSQQTTKTTTRRNAAGQPIKPPQRSNSASRTVPAKSRDQRNEMQKLASNPNLRGAPKKPAPAAPTRQPITTAPKKPTTKPTSSRPPAAPAARTTNSRSPAPKGPAAPGTKKTTTTTTTTKNTSRSPAPKGPAAPGTKNTTTTTTKKTTTTTRTTSSRSPAGGDTKKTTTTTTTRNTTSRSPAPKTKQVTVKKTTRTQSAERGRRH
jgi:hypothetical protein